MGTKRWKLPGSGKLGRMTEHLCDKGVAVSLSKWQNTTAIAAIHELCLTHAAPTVQSQQLAVPNSTSWSLLPKLRIAPDFRRRLSRNASSALHVPSQLFCQLSAPPLFSLSATQRCCTVATASCTGYLKLLVFGNHTGYACLRLHMNTELCLLSKRPTFGLSLTARLLLKAVQILT